MSDKVSKRVFLCECVNFSFVAGDTVSLEFIWPGPAPLAGQFFLIKPMRSGVFLGRPISVAGWNPYKKTIFEGNADRRADRDRRGGSDRYQRDDNPLSKDRRIDEGGVLHFLITRRGQGSKELTEIRIGETAELTGPLGNSWPIDQFPPDIPKGKASNAIALVGGGAGIAPLLMLVPELKKRSFDFYAGFGTNSFGVENIKPRALIISSENGSDGVKGRIGDFFSPLGYSIVFACGPDALLKVVSDACIAHGIPCFVSTGKIMACGVGACLGCKIKTIHGSVCSCSDGPIFNAEELCFED